MVLVQLEEGECVSSLGSFVSAYTEQQRHRHLQRPRQAEVYRPKSCAKSRLGMTSVTVDDFSSPTQLAKTHASPFTRSSNEGVVGSLGDAGVSMVSSAVCFQNLKSHRHTQSTAGSLLHTLTSDFEETLFRACLHSMSVTPSKPVIQMIADVRFKGGRCRLPFIAHSCHRMWVGCIRPEGLVPPSAGRMQICLLHCADFHPADYEDVFFQEAEEVQCVLAGRPMLVDCSHCCQQGGNGLVRMCHYQGGRLMRGVQLPVSGPSKRDFNSNGEDDAPSDGTKGHIRVVFSFTENDDAKFKVASHYKFFDGTSDAMPRNCNRTRRRPSIVMH